MLTLTDAALNSHVTPIVEAVTNEDYAARKIAPIVPVSRRNFAYRTWSKDHLRYSDSVVGERGEALPSGFGMVWTKDETKDHFREIFLPKSILDLGAKEAIKFATEEGELMGEEFLIEEEYWLATFMTDSSKFTNHSDPTIPWSDPDGDPAKDIGAIFATIRGAIGRNPNTLIMTDDVFMELSMNHARSTDGFQAAAPGQAILNYINNKSLKNLIVTAAVYNTAKKGQTDVLTDMWGTENLWAAYIHPTPSRSQPSFASTFENKAGNYTEGEPSKSPKGQKAFTHRDFLTKVRNETAAYYFHGVLS